MLTMVERKALMMKHKRTLLTSCISLFLTSTPGLAGDLTGHDRGPFQWQHHVVGAAPKSGSIGLSYLYDQSENYRLIPRNRDTSGTVYRSGFKVRFPISERLHLGLGFDLLNSRLVDNPDGLLDDELSARGASFQIALRYQFLSLWGVHLAVIPRFEPTSYSRRSFALPSKSRLGATFAASYELDRFEFAYNTGFRYRPTEILDRFKISHDFSNSGRITARFDAVSLSAELVERNLYMLDSLRREPVFRLQVGQYHRIGASFESSSWTASLFVQRALRNKLFAVAEKAVVASVSVSFGSSDERSHEVEAPDERIPQSESQDSPVIESEPAVPEAFDDGSPQAEPEPEPSQPEVVPESSDEDRGKDETETTSPNDEINPEQMLRELEVTRERRKATGSEMDGFHFSKQSIGEYLSPAERTHAEHQQAENELKSIEKTMRLIESKQSIHHNNASK